MKFNLKNFPKEPESLALMPLWGSDVENWKNGFEKELWNKLPYFVPGSTPERIRGQIELIKEILGEETKTE